MARLVAFWLPVAMLTAIADGVGIKRRLREAREAQEAQDNELDAGSAPGGASSSSQGPYQPRGGIRRRLQPTGDEPSGAPPEDRMPLMDTLKKKWATGKFSSAEILELVRGAAEQGARGMEHLSQMVLTMLSGP